MEKAIAMWVFCMAYSLFLPDIQTYATFCALAFFIAIKGGKVKSTFFFTFGCPSVDKWVQYANAVKAVLPLNCVYF
ncbi:hypothetical protein JY531_00725 [Serratia marcescens]|uniref:hypothetical protein n=1 Tax=Serratia TaxID=613 RepID=UPI0018D6113D|nr:hypothetical protein [Serratia marcescens]MBH2804300.1 hypothetical protein [Serratia marcescens]MBH2958327.1 hypothetical protein [Serratia marcescens]MBN5235083.1 hypothetical protein [Serratia marcescens]MBN5366061.1 hypothetical protein [Serratia marcescens]